MRTACRQCGVMLEYVPKDILEKRYTDIDGSRDIHWYIVCPACRSHVTVQS
jgi:hypothetical protein